MNAKQARKWIVRADCRPRKRVNRPGNAASIIGDMDRPDRTPRTLTEAQRAGSLNPTPDDALPGQQLRALRQHRSRGQARTISIGPAVLIETRVRVEALAPAHGKSWQTKNVEPVSKTYR